MGFDILFFYGYRFSNLEEVNALTEDHFYSDRPSPLVMDFIYHWSLFSGVHPFRYLLWAGDTGRGA